MNSWCLALGIAGGVLLSGCASERFGGPGHGTISCKVLYRERMLIPSDAITVVELVDTTAGKPYQVLTWATVSGYTSPPISFSFEFELAPIVVEHTYGLVARIENNGQVMFASPEPVPVLTHGYGRQAELVVHRSP